MKKKIIEHPADMKDESILIMLGNVPNIEEYDKGKIIIVSSQSILLFEDWTCLKEYRDEDPTNYYTISFGTSVVPLGYLEIIPGFKDIPILLLAGASTISIINLNDQYHEPFIIAENTSAFAQQAFFFKKEDFGLSIYFTIKRTIDKDNIRLNLCRMPFKPDFLDILKRYTRLPFTNTEEALKIKKLQEAVSTAHS